MNAFITDNHTVIRQIFGDCKDAELTMIPTLLDALDVKGATLTMDAMACQVSITEKIIDRKADYLIGLKKNQPTAYADAVQLFAMKDFPCDSWKETDKGHGRLESRSYLSINISKDNMRSFEKFAGI
ncbi:MAG: ISAs1 family transposase [Mailhella sp.]|nr:ISAs1 family transposase [Mailhella sp.]